MAEELAHFTMLRRRRAIDDVCCGVGLRQGFSLSGTEESKRVWCYHFHPTLQTSVAPLFVATMFTAVVRLAPVGGRFASRAEGAHALARQCDGRTDDDDDDASRRLHCSYGGRSEEEEEEARSCGRSRASSKTAACSAPCVRE